MLSRPTAMPKPWIMLKDHRSIAGVLGDFLASLLTLLFQLLQVGDDHGQQLENNGGTDVGHDPQGKDGQLLQGTAGEHVEDTENGPLHGVKKGLQGYAVDAGRGDMNPDPVDRQQRRGVKQIGVSVPEF